MACRTVRTRKRAVLAVCSALVDDEVDGPLDCYHKHETENLSILNDSKDRMINSWKIGELHAQACYETEKNQIE